MTIEQKIKLAPSIIHSVVESQKSFAIDLLTSMKKNFPVEYAATFAKFIVIINDEEMNIRAAKKGLTPDSNINEAFITLVERSLFEDSKNPSDDFNQMLNDFIELVG